MPPLAGPGRKFPLGFAAPPRGDGRAVRRRGLREGGTGDGNLFHGHRRRGLVCAGRLGQFASGGGLWRPAYLVWHFDQGEIRWLSKTRSRANGKGKCAPLKLWAALPSSTG